MLQHNPLLLDPFHWLSPAGLDELVQILDAHPDTPPPAPIFTATSFCRSISA